MESYVVSDAPFIHSKNDVNKMFLYIAVALLLPAIYGIILFGLNSLLIIFVSVASCFLSECLFNVLNKKKFFVDNFSFFVTAMVLALTMPYSTPWYYVAASGFVSIFVVKLALGGLGINKFNPANTGRCFAGIMVAGMSGALYNFTVNGDTYTSLTSGGTNTLTNLINGQAVGGIGTTCIIILFICFVFLAITRVIDFKITILAVLSYFVTQFFMVGLESTMLNILSGSFLFVSIFVITDPNTSPNSLLGKLVYSVLFGVLSAVVWNLGLLGENTVFVVALFVNMLVPFMDKYLVLRPLRLGGLRNAHKK